MLRPAPLFQTSRLRRAVRAGSFTDRLVRSVTAITCLCLAVLLWAQATESRAQGPPPAAYESGSLVERPPLRLDPTKRIDLFQRSNWTDQDGLPINRVYDVYQDRSGYIWVGTQGGLARFNGQSFRVYNQDDTPGIPINQTYNLERARNGGFWVGTSGGGIARYRNGTFRAYTEEDGLVNNAVVSIEEDSTGTLWIATEEGFSRFRDGRFTNFTTADGLVDDHTFAVGRDTQGRLLVSSIGGIHRLVEGDSLYFRESNRYPELVGKTVIDFLIDRRGNFWAATLENGVYRYGEGETLHLTSESGLGADGINSLYEDHEGAVWIGTYSGGISRYFDGTVSTFTQENGLAANRVESFMQDRENNLWIATNGGGLTQIRNSKFSAYTPEEGLTGTSVLSVTQDEEGVIWVATENSGLNRIEDGEVTQITTEDGLPVNSLHTVLATNDGRIWIGGRGGMGACFFRSEDQVRSGDYTCLTEEDGLIHNNIYSLYEDSEGALWIGTTLGLNRYHDGELTSFTTDDGLSGSTPTAVKEDSEGSLWVGTFSNGLNRYEDGTFTAYTADGPLPSDRVLALTRDEAGRLWIGTLGGLCRYDRGAFACVSSEDGLFTNEIVQLEVDRSEHIWIGGLNGFGRASLDSLDALIDGRTDTLIHETYGYGDGLPSPEGQGGIQPSSWEMNDGSIWLTTAGGAAFVDPTRIPYNPVAPRVRIEQLLVEDQERTVRDTTRFEPGTGKFDFRFAALTYVNNAGTRFEYRLDGYDEGWTSPQQSRTAHYTNLSPGTYTFRVRAHNQDGVPSEERATLVFTIEPFFYQTIWFYVLCALAVIGAAFGAYKLRVRQIQQREEELSRLVDEQTHELQEREEELEKLNESLEEEVERQLEVILEERERAERKKIQLEERKKYEEELISAKEKAEESAKLKSTILMNMSHEIRTPLTSILGFAEVLEEEIEGDHLQFAELIRKSGERLLDTLNSVLDMSQLEANSMTIEATRLDVVERVEEILDMFEAQAKENDLYLTVETNTDGEPVWAEMDESFLDRIVDNLVGNALKFTEEGGVTVRVEDHGDTLRLEVEDTGIGISEEFLPHLFDAFKQESTGLRRSHEGTGLGMAITKRLVELMDGTIEVDSEEGVGTTFIIDLPREIGSREADHDPLDRDDEPMSEIDRANLGSGDRMARLDDGLDHDPSTSDADLENGSGRSIGEEDDSEEELTTTEAESRSP